MDAQLRVALLTDDRVAINRYRQRVAVAFADFQRRSPIVSVAENEQLRDRAIGARIMPPSRARHDIDKLIKMSNLQQSSTIVRDTHET